MVSGQLICFLAIRLLVISYDLWPQQYSTRYRFWSPGMFSEYVIHYSRRIWLLATRRNFWSDCIVSDHVTGFLTTWNSFTSPDLVSCHLKWFLGTWYSFRALDMISRHLILFMATDMVSGNVLMATLNG